MKLPWGIHPRTGRRSYFIKDTLEEYLPQKELLDDVVKYSVNTVKKIVAANHSAENVDMKKKFTEVDTNLDDFQITSDAVRAVMVSCNLIRYLCQKAKTVHYLNHYERLSILYIFGHLGEEGKEFIHKVMSFTLNYSYQVTQKFVVTCSHHLNLTILKWGLPARLPFRAKLKQAISACPAVLLFIRIRIFFCAVRHILYKVFFLLPGY